MQARSIYKREVFPVSEVVNSLHTQAVQVPANQDPVAPERAAQATGNLQVTRGKAPGQGRPRVVIVGAGFAGIHAAKSLAKLAVDVTVIDRSNHHTFQPLLYQVALAVLSPADIAQPIRTILRRQMNTEVLMDQVVGIYTAAHKVTLARGSSVSYDYLALATGTTHSYFG